MLRNGLEPWHLITVALIVILLFGSKKLPDAARGLGKSMRILKSEARALKADDAAASTAAGPQAGTAAQATVHPNTASTVADASPTPEAHTA